MCIRYEDRNNCCSTQSIKNGKTLRGIQRYRCKVCKSQFQEQYIYKAYKTEINSQIILLTKEGCGIRSISRILQISSTTLLKRILQIAKNIKRPYPILKGKYYEVDEIFTYGKHKDNRICIAYSFEVGSGNVIEIRPI